MSTQIDYSEIPQAPVESTSEEWEAPVHKFFGKKLGNGKTEKEPTYTFKPFPSLRYAQRDGKIVARVVNSDQELSALGDGWSDTPATFGHIGAPSFDQAMELREKAAQAVESVEAPRRGRPPKGE